MKPGERIRKFRKEKGLTQNEFAQKLGYTQGFLSEIEKGKAEPSREFLKKLAEVYNLSADEVLYGKSSEEIGRKEFIAKIEVTEKERKLIEATEGPVFVEKFVCIPIAKSEISAGTPREVEENADGMAIIYREWAKNYKDFTAVRVKGESMKPTIPNGSLVGIDHSKKDPKTLNGKVVALRKDGEATIKRLRIVSEDLMLGMPDNPDFMHETVVLRGEEINNAIIGKVVWWWGLQK